MFSDDRVLGDDLAVSGTGAFNDKNAGDQKTVIASGIALLGKDAGNYVANQTAETRASVLKRELKISAKGQDKAYDGTTDVAVVLSDNAVKGDVVAYEFAEASFDTKEAGANKTVTVSGIRVFGADANNYTFNRTATTTATVAKRDLVVTAVADDRIYDGSARAAVELSDDRVEGDVLSVQYRQATFDTKHAGTHKTVTVAAVAIHGKDAANYTTGTTITSYADVAPRVLLVTVDSSDKVYDGIADARVTFFDDREKGDHLIVSGNASFADKHAGAKKAVSVSNIELSGPDADNYTFNRTAAAVASITPRTLTVAADGSDRLYDGTAAAVVELSDDRVDDDAIEVRYASASFVNKHAGSDKSVLVSGIAVSGRDAANYSLKSTNVHTTATIDPQPLVITADTLAKVYGAADPELNYVVTGLASTDKMMGALARDAGSNAGIYTIGRGTLGTNAGPDDYTVAFKGATLTIYPRQISVVAQPNHKFYDGSIRAVAVPVVSGNLVKGDSAEFLEAYADPNVGTGKTLIPSGIIRDGNNGKNYIVEFVENHAGVIEKEPIKEKKLVVHAADEAVVDMPHTHTIQGVGPLAPQGERTGVRGIDVPAHTSPQGTPHVSPAHVAKPLHPAEPVHIPVPMKPVEAPRPSRFLKIFSLEGTNEGSDAASHAHHSAHEASAPTHTGAAPAVASVHTEQIHTAAPSVTSATHEAPVTHVEISAHAQPHELAKAAPHELEIRAEEQHLAVVAPKPTIKREEAPHKDEAVEVVSRPIAKLMEMPAPKVPVASVIEKSAPKPPVASTTEKSAPKEAPEEKPAQGFKLPSFLSAFMSTTKTAPAPDNLPTAATPPPSDVVVRPAAAAKTAAPVVAEQPAPAPKAAVPQPVAPVPVIAPKVEVVPAPELVKKLVPEVAHFAPEVLKVQEVSRPASIVPPAAPVVHAEPAPAPVSLPLREVPVVAKAIVAEVAHPAPVVPSIIHEALVPPPAPRIHMPVPIKPKAAAPIIPPPTPEPVVLKVSAPASSPTPAAPAPVTPPAEHFVPVAAAPAVSAPAPVAKPTPAPITPVAAPAPRPPLFSVFAGALKSAAQNPPAAPGFEYKGLSGISVMPKAPPRS